MSESEGRVRFDISAGTVTLDLAQLRTVCAIAMRNTRMGINRMENDVLNQLDLAHRAERGGDEQEHYIRLSAANASAQRLSEFALEYAAAVQAYFHICEAIKREEVKIVKE